MKKPFSASELIFRVRKAIDYAEKIRQEFLESDTPHGTIEELGLASLLFYLNHNSKSGTLTLHSDIQKQKATVYFQNGKIVEAVFDSLKGEDVVYNLIAWEEGEYKFSEQDISFCVNIDKTVTELVLEGISLLENL